MARERYMDPQAVLQVAEKLETIGGVLRKVSQVMETLIRILDTTAFIGNVGGAAVSAYLKTIQPQIEELAKLCEEVSGFTSGSAKDWIRASQAG